MSLLPMNIQSLFPFGLTGLLSLQSKTLLQVIPYRAVLNHPFFGLLTSVHIYRKDHRCDTLGVYWPSHVFTFYFHLFIGMGTSLIMYIKV